ncbi:SARP family transcriptional regulator [Actinomadura soli]|uniref:SARP family transcriptional regulator n=1 Tax=Actinomadura soli TaxID=2508997 RepID=A0A5C4J9J2_9ACTN|nr:AAA family ATPase [Actinomadura soli]TMQ97821.1 SARP family transcriptional regulator [Actinomadura soli]
MLYASLLGDQVIGDDETGARTRSPRTVGLVAYLAAHAGSPQTRQRIAGIFWPDSTDAQALTNLRRELHHLRRILGPEPSLVVTSRDLCWRDSGTCLVDLRVFAVQCEEARAALASGDATAAAEHATRAIAEYKGDLLPGVHDDWVLDARSELERRCVEMCDLVATMSAGTGDPTRAVDAARRRIRLQPLEEVGYRVLIQLQADLGDRAGAISTYHHCASVLERELGVVPDPATRRAFQRLMADAGSSEGEEAVAVAPDTGRSGVAVARLVGRSRELDQLCDLWRRAVAGRPGCTLVRGAAGVGKTRLVTEFAELARRQGAVVAGSQCFGSSGRLALAPVADWLRTPAARSATATLDETWRAEVDRLVPVKGQEARGAGPRAMADAWQRPRFFEGLARALIAVGQPMVLVLDNMQWCDQDTLAFLTFYLGLAGDTPVMVAGTLRDEGLGDGPELADWTVRMRTADLLTDLTLDPLEAEGTAGLAEAITGRRLPEADATLLHATTGGFPLYVVETLRGAHDPDGRPGGGPDGAGADPDGTGVDPDGTGVGDLTSVLRNRLERASAPAREIAGLAAAVGTDFTLDLLTEASDLDAGVVVEAVDELWRHRIMREFRGGYDFSHDLLRDAAYAAVTPPKRWLLHRRVAQGLELLHADDTDAVSAQLAEQYARGGRPDRALAYYRRAADVAAGLFAHTESIRLQKEALSIVRAMPEGRGRDTKELEILKAMAAPLNARYGYSSPHLRETIERAVALAESLGDDDSLLDGLVVLWTSRFVRGRITEGYRAAVQALDSADPHSAASGPAHFAVGGGALSLGRPADGLRHLELAVTLTRGAFMLSVGTRPDVHGTAWAAHAHWLLGHDDEALASCTDAIKQARTTSHPYVLAVALAYGSVTHQMRRDMPALKNTVTELRDLCGRYDFAYYREWGLILDGWHQGGPAGVNLARQGIANLKAQDSFARMPYWLSLLADLLARDNRPDAARATLDAALAAAQSHDDVWWLPEVMRMRAAYDDHEQAIARLRSAAQTASTQGSLALLHRCNHDLQTHHDQ